MGASQGLLKLRVNQRESVTALWDKPEPIDSYRDLFNKDVVVEGVAVFRPSGRILRLDAKAIEPAVVQDDFFRRLPEAHGERDYAHLARLTAPSEKYAYARLLGALPAEESDEEFQSALDAIR